MYNSNAAMAQKSAKRETDNQKAGLDKLLHDLRALKTRVMTLELARLDEDRSRSMDKASEEARASDGKVSEIEARGYADAEAQRNREMIELRFRKMDEGLDRLAGILEHAGDLEGYRDRLTAYSKSLEEKQKEFEEKRKSFKSDMAKVEERNVELDQKEEEIATLAHELEAKETYFQEETDKLAKMRGELNKDFDNLGRMRADLEAEKEKQMAEIAEEREKLEADKKKIAEIKAHAPDQAIEKLKKGMEKLLRQMFDEE